MSNDLERISIKDAIKRSKNLEKSRSKEKTSVNNVNKNIDKIREIGREINELKRKKSMANTPEKQQNIQDKIDAKKEKFNELKERGRPGTR